MWDGIRNNKIEAERKSPSSEVKSYKLSDEELEKYRNQSVVKEVTKKPLNLHKKGYVRKDDEKVDKSNGLTKEIYLKLHEEGKLDKEIMNEYEMNHNVFYKLKNKWGLVGVNQKGKKKEKVVDAPLNKVEKEIVQKEPVKVTAPENKSCNCVKSSDEVDLLKNQLLELKSELAYQKKLNEDLSESIRVLQRYRSMYLATAETLKVHLP